MTPLGDRILVKPDAKGDVKKGSIYIPEVARSKPQEGEVVAAVIAPYEDKKMEANGDVF